MVSQLFLGIRLECAKCHHHPFESWGQEQFYEFAAYFARVGRKGTGLSPPISGGEEIVFTAKSGTVKHPLTGKVLAPEAALRIGPGGRRSRRRPARGAGPLDDRAGEPVLRPGDRQPRLGRPDGPGHRRAGRRPPRDQSAEQRAAARRPGRRLPPPRLRPEAPDPDDHGVVGLRPRAPSRTTGTSPTRGTSPATTGSGCGPRSCSTRSRT